MNEPAFHRRPARTTGRRWWREALATSRLAHCPVGGQLDAPPFMAVGSADPEGRRLNCTRSSVPSTSAIRSRLAIPNGFKRRTLPRASHSIAESSPRSPCCRRLISLLHRREHTFANVTRGALNVSSYSPQVHEARQHHLRPRALDQPVALQVDDQPLEVRVAEVHRRLARLRQRPRARRGDVALALVDVHRLAVATWPHRADRRAPAPRPGRAGRPRAARRIRSWRRPRLPARQPLGLLGVLAGQAGASTPVRLISHSRRSAPGSRRSPRAARTRRHSAPARTRRAADRPRRWREPPSPISRNARSAARMSRSAATGSPASSST